MSENPKPTETPEEMPLVSAAEVASWQQRAMVAEHNELIALRVLVGVLQAKDEEKSARLAVLEGMLADEASLGGGRKASDDDHRSGALDGE